MRIIDVCKLGVRDIKKHKLRFCLNTLSISVIFMVIAVLMSFLLTLNATADKDMQQHLIQQGNAVTVSISASYHAGLFGVTWDEMQLMADCMTEYDRDVKTREDIRHGNDINASAGEWKCPVEVYYFGEESPYIGDSEPSLIDGIDWRETSGDEKYIWIGEDILQAIQEVNPAFAIGDAVGFVVEGRISVSLKTVGLIDGSDFYVSRKTAIENHFVDVYNVYYDITLQDADNPLKALRLLQKDMAKIDAELVKDEPEQDRIGCAEFIQFLDYKYTKLPYQIIASLVIVFFSILILGVLKNNAVISVFDNIKSYSLLRCIGLGNKKIVGISIMEAMLCLCLSAVLGGGLSFAFISVIRTLANQVIGAEMYDMSTMAYDSAWWVMLCYFVALALVVIAYFSFTLVKYLKRKNLLATLKRE